ncbi:class I SAM-dependent methyltransferase [Neobacillus muris]|uniref:class I SAM-dependent methyltransferase n=1 Tax=Neobacillus muris TaxID=2941334 RepID=UPI002040EBBE|nr:class I SAM-dependent methyltransferase [Neobacillus muris]
MGINFHHEKTGRSYTTRNADDSWVNAIKRLVPIDTIKHAADIGCGGGIYSKALCDLGVQSVVGVDFSEPILEGAIKNCRDYPNISFKNGNAYHSGLESGGYDLLLERALVHHLDDLQTCFDEGYRVLKDDGYYIVQDRTPEDCLVKGDASHIRGYFFEVFPRLIEKETSRRHSSQYVIETLKNAGFREIQEVKLWEIRQVFAHKDHLLKDLSERTGRSILHELDDQELNQLVEYIDKQILIEENIVEQDRWTIWKAVK